MLVANQEFKTVKSVLTLSVNVT